uniref:Uncharacterized protein n=1 Tax=Rhizophora mucronata TaxID=61149 RepID=A0A2P2PP76_RHIMU
MSVVRNPLHLFLIRGDTKPVSQCYCNESTERKRWLE